nr:hypothetical protein KitaXyl93_27930 [Kitasatospora sp. Xyl93]
MLPQSSAFWAAEQLTMLSGRIAMSPATARAAGRAMLDGIRSSWGARVPWGGTRAGGCAVPAAGVLREPYGLRARPVQQADRSAGRSSVAGTGVRAAAERPSARVG